MRKFRAFLWLAIAIMGIMIILLMNPSSTSPNIKQLQDIEVRNYKGERLDSVVDFRENSIKGVQYIDINDYQLEIFGLVENPKNYTYEEVINHQSYEKVVQLNCVEGWSAKILWEGILVRDLLDEVSPKPEGKVVILYAYDGYSTQYPVEYFYDNDIILAYKMNNVTIPPERGYPFQLIAEDRWGYKWIKWITRIELSDDTNYEGYWESRGYSKEGKLNESFFD